MITRTIRWSGTLCLLAVLLLSTVFPSLAGPAREPGQVAQPAESVLIRLAYVSFDPLRQLPDLSGRPAYTPEEAAAAGIYILQFSGPVLPEWKQAVLEAGGQLDGYLPDYAFIARLDGAALARVRALPFVRWVGPYEPAYRLAADATGDETRSYRVALASWADPAAARSALAGLGVRTDGDGPIFLAEMNGAQLGAAARLPDVVWIEPYRPRELHNDVGGGTIMGGSTAWANGYTGSGVTIAVADTGLDTGNPAAIHQDFSGRVAHISSWPVVYADYGSGCVTQNPGADDGPSDVDSGHGSHTTGSVAGSGARSSGAFKGLAYQASITFQAIEQWTDFPAGCPIPDGYYLTGIPADERDLFTQAYGWGARVHNNSWGASVAGAYNQTSANFDDFVHDYQDMAIVVSAGNSGRDANADGYVDPDSMGSPGTAKNVITVGASDNERASGGLSAYTWYQAWPSDFPVNPTRDDRISDNRQELAAFSSRGPADDGRILPDVVAPGTDIISVRSSLATGTGWGLYDAYYMYMGGTSMASPLTAGAAALVRDYYQTTEGHSSPSAALIKATLINTAVDITGYGNTAQEAGQPIPNNHEGWGRVDVAAATTPGRQFVDDWTGLNTGQTATYQFSVNAGQPFKVTLVWSDAAGTPGAGAALVNNLNLRVTAPDGTTTYWGNHFSGGWTTPGGSADTVNNVENVYIQSPTAGTWTVQVIGQNVPQGPQSFALVVDGSFATPFDITSITPSGGLVGYTIHATIHGTDFGGSMTARLTRSGQPDINGTGVSVINQSTLTCNFNLAGAALGAWNVVVTRSGQERVAAIPVELGQRGERPVELLPAGATRAADITAVERVSVEAPTGLPPAAPVEWSAPEAVLWDNGPLVTHPGNCSGQDASRLQTDLGMNTLGFGHQFLIGNRMADDFTVTDASGWQIDTITFFAYQTNAPTTPSPITGVYYQIWDGPPNDPGSSVVWGDLVTNRLLSTTFTSMQRDSGTSPCANNRYIFANVASAGVTLPPGTYWLDWMTDGSLASGPWAPPVTILGQTTTGNALQYTTSSGAWGPANDSGTLTQQGMPFVIAGSIGGGGEEAILPDGFTVSAPVADLYLPIIVRAWQPLPGPPTINPFVPNPDPDGNYTVVWTPGAGPAPTSYQLEENGVVIATGYVGTSYPISGRTPGTYTYRVRGRNAYGYGPWSAPQSVTVSPPPTNPIQNGDFEQGAVIWTQYSTHGWPLIINTGFPGSVTPHSGSWAVWLGGDYDDISYIAQTVTIPSGSTVLSFYYWIASQDYCGYDFGGVIVNSTVVDQFDLCSATNTGGWVRRTVNLAAYAGQTVQIQIRAETDNAFNSNLFVDDVALGASLGRETPAPTRPFDPATAAPRE